LLNQNKELSILKNIPIIFLGLVIYAPQQTLARPVLAAGAWEMHTSISMQDPKTGKDKIVNNTLAKHCLSPEYIAQNPYLSPDFDKAKMEKKQATCSVKDASQTENSAAWKMSCSTLDGHMVNVSINNSVSARHVQSNAEQEVKKDGKSVFAKIQVIAKHIGECAEGIDKL
jgi:hypothetical protein